MKLKFKQGDKVRCINPTKGNYGGSGWEFNYEFIIDRGNEYEDFNGNVYWEKGKSFGVYEHSLELIEQEPNYEIY